MRLPGQKQFSHLMEDDNITTIAINTIYLPIGHIVNVLCVINIRDTEHFANM